MPTLPPAPPRPLPLVMGLATLLPAALLGWAALLVVPSATPGQLLLALAVVVLPAATLWGVARAGMAGGGALAGLIGAIVAVSDSSLRASGGGFDAQSVAKFGLWVLGGLLVFWRWRHLLAALSQPASAALALFGLWCLLSTTWSATPLYTMAAALAWLGLWVSATAAARVLPLQQGLAAMVLALTLTMALSLLLWQLAPAMALSAMDNGRVLRLSGVFGSPNNLGRAAALLVLLALLLATLARQRRALLLVALGLSLGGCALVLSGSRTSILALLAGLAVAACGRRPLAALGLALLLGTMAAMLWAWPALLEALTPVLSRSGRTEELSSFTGRTAIWDTVLDIIGRAPWLGHGFASSRELIPAYFQGPYGWTTTSAHNLWLQAWLTTGGVGLALVLLAQAAGLVAALRRPHAVRDAVVAFVLVIGLFEASATGPAVNLMSFAWLWAAALGATAASEPQ